MTEESALRLKAREALQAGKLPNRDPDTMWGGPGLGDPCAVCARTVQPDELGFELEFAGRVDGSPELSNVHVHVRCFMAWDLERENVEATGSTHEAIPAAETAEPAAGGPVARAGTFEPESEPFAGWRGLSAAKGEGTIAGCDCKTPYRRGPR